MGGRVSSLKEVRLVVVGGGYAGMSLAGRLKSAKAPYTIVDPRDAFHHNVAAVRAVSEPGFAKKTFIPFKEAFGDNFIQDFVDNVDPANKTVQLRGGQNLPYDALVIATGSGGPFPGKVELTINRDDAIARYQKAVEKVQSSQRVVIVGGGPNGVEVATEVATDYPDKEVVIVHSGDKLIGNYLSDTFHSKLDEYMDKLKIKRILGEKIENLDSMPEGAGGTLLTDKGTKIDGDVFFKCIGLWVNSGAYSKGLANVMEPNGRLRVNEFLQVEGHDDIFAVGDCNNVPENKLAYLAMLQSKSVFENLCRKFENSAMVPYVLDPNPIALMISVGRNHGICQDKKGHLKPELFVKAIKSNNMFIPQYWAKMGQKPPQ